MDMLQLADEIIEGRRLSRGEDLSYFITCDYDALCEGADKIRKHFVGDRVDLCSIVNGRSGKCPEDCKYCAQSAHYHTECNVYDFLSEEELLEACKLNEREGVDRFSIVTAGRNLSGEEFEKALRAFKRMKEECDIELCASMGFLNREQFRRLKEIGVDRYHHNIETSKRFFSHICTTHTYEQKFATLKVLKEEGMKICSGGIIGMGETWEDRIDMAVSLSEVGVDSIPLNALMPIKGTPLENQERLTEEDIVRTVAIFRYINPTAHIRLAAGRALMENDGKKAFESGASATITGNMLTTVAKATIRSDREMLSEMGRKIKERSQS
ncbi:MAG: biotin synthase BioB [Lachnospiraceae bacterium]